MALATTPCLAEGYPHLQEVRATTLLATVHSRNPNGTCWQAAPVTDELSADNTLGLAPYRSTPSGPRSVC